MKSHREINIGKMGTSLLILSRLNQWEKLHLPGHGSAAARDLYFLLAENYTHSALTRKPLKTYSNISNDRLMRQKIQMFEHQGWIRIGCLRGDRRTKILLPRPKLVRLFIQHATMLRQISGRLTVS